MLHCDCSVPHLLNCMKRILAALDSIPLSRCVSDLGPQGLSAIHSNRLVAGHADAKHTGKGATHLSASTAEAVAEAVPCRATPSQSAKTASLLLLAEGKHTSSSAPNSEGASAGAAWLPLIAFLACCFSAAAGTSWKPCAPQARVGWEAAALLFVLQLDHDWHMLAQMLLLSMPSCSCRAQRHIRCVYVVCSP